MGEHLYILLFLQLDHILPFLRLPVSTTTFIFMKPLYNSVSNEWFQVKLMFGLTHSSLNFTHMVAVQIQLL